MPNMEAPDLFKTTDLKLGGLVGEQKLERFAPESK